MSKLFRAGTPLVCVAFTASACAQTNDNAAAPDYGADCRAVSAQAEIDGTMQEVTGRACRQPDGTWQLVRDTPDGNVLVYPAAVYPYPDLWYWGPPLFIGVGAGFVFVDHFHRFHHFGHVDHDRFGAPHGMGFGRRPFGGGRMHGPGGMHGFGGMHRH